MVILNHYLFLFRWWKCDVLGGFSYNGTLKLQKIESNINSSEYTDLLKNAFENNFNNIKFNKNKKIRFQQDNAPIHCSKYTKNWLKSQGNIKVLKWPAKSPDLNPIENLWGYLTLKVYEGKKQYSSKKELENAIIKEWKNIDLKMLKKLVNDMPLRIGKVILNQGKFINR